MSPGRWCYTPHLIAAHRRPGSAWAAATNMALAAHARERIVENRSRVQFAALRTAFRRPPRLPRSVLAGDHPLDQLRPHRTNGGYLKPISEKSRSEGGFAS